MDSVLKSLNRGLHAAFENDERVYLIGEDLLDPYGGAFKVSAGLSSQYPERVLTSPVSEAAITGVATGMALRGLRPVVEIMFGDFITLAADQIVNGLTKFEWMYNSQVQLPVVIRTPMGGRRGYGPTHSQTLEKLFLGVPGLRVLAANTLSDPGELLQKAILEDDGPVLLIENKLLYTKELFHPSSDIELKSMDTTNGYAKSHLLSIAGAPANSLTLAAYGYMAELAREALLKLAYGHEIFCQLFVPDQLSPFSSELDPLLQTSLQESGRLLTVEEGTLSAGWGAELLARASENLGSGLQKVSRLAAAEQPIPASMPLEEAALPGVDDIVAAVQRMV